MSDIDSGSDDVSTTQKGRGHAQLNRDGQPLTHKQKQNLKRKAKRKDKYQQQELEKKIKIKQPPPLSEDEDEGVEQEESESGNEMRVLNEAAHKSQSKISKAPMHVESDSSDDDSNSELKSSSVTTKITTSIQKHRVETQSDSQSEDDEEGRNEEDNESGNAEQEDEKESGDEEDAELDEEESLSGEDEAAAVEVTSAETVDQAYAKLRKELSNMPFDELQLLKEKIGIKLYNQVMFGQEANTKQKRFKRENKNRPTELSSKRKPRRLREVVQVKKQMVRDPRFDDLSGEYKEDIFKSTYSFLSDVKKNEKQKVLKQLTKEKDDEKKEQLEYLVRRMTAQEKAERTKDQQQQRDRHRKKQERALVSEGKRPFYLKQSDKKKLELAEKFRDLKKAGKVDTYLTKKRKKNAQKERRNLPAQPQ